MGSKRFTPHDLAEVLRDLFRTEASGHLLLVGDGGEEIHLHVACGLIDLAFEDSHHAEFLQELADDSVLSAPVPQEWKETPPKPEALAEHIGDALEQPDFRDRIFAETLHSLQRAFRLSGGTFTFTAGAERAWFDPDIPRTLRALLEGIGAVSRWAPVHRILMSQTRVLRPAKVPLFPIECLPLAPEQGYVLSRMDGQSTFADLTLLIPDGDPDSLTRFVYSALVLGFVEFDPALVEPFQLSEYADHDRDQRERAEKELERIDSFYASIRTDDPYRIFGVTDGASWNEIKQSYEDRKMSFKAERFLAGVQAERREELRIIETSLVEAYLKIQSLRMGAAGNRARDKSGEEETYLEDVQGKRKESVKTENQEKQEENDRLAGDYYHQAREFFAQGDFHNAVQYCHLSIRHKDDIADCFALLGRSLAKNPAHRWQLQAENAFKKAIELDPWNARVYLQMAEFYRDQGMTQRANRLQEKAFSISPSLRAAQSADRA